MQDETETTGCKSGKSALLCADPLAEFAKLMAHLGTTEKMTASERAIFFAFFCHGFYARAGEAAYQNGSAEPSSSVKKAWDKFQGLLNDNDPAKVKYT